MISISVPVLFDAVSGSEEVSSINEAAPAHVHIVILLLLEDGHLPGILPELRVPLCVPLCRVVDPPVDPVSVPLATLTVLTELRLAGETVESLVELTRLLPDISDGVYL